MANSLINYPYNNRILIQETGSGMYFMPATSGVLSGNWIYSGEATQSGNLINKGYLESGARAYNKTSISFFPFYGNYTGTNLQEYWLSDSIICTGVVLTCSTAGSGTIYYTSGTSGSPIFRPYTFDVYLRSGSSQTNQFRVTFPTGNLYSGSGINNVVLSGGYACGFSVISGMSGINSLNVALLGYLRY